MKLIDWLHRLRSVPSNFSIWFRLIDGCRPSLTTSKQFIWRARFRPALHHFGRCSLYLSGRPQLEQTSAPSARLRGLTWKTAHLIISCCVSHFLFLPVSLLPVISSTSTDDTRIQFSAQRAMKCLTSPTDFGLISRLGQLTSGIWQDFAVESAVGSDFVQNFMSRALKELSIGFCFSHLRR